MLASHFAIITGSARNRRIFKDLRIFKRSACSMDDHGVTLKKVIREMNNFADKSLAASWDNVGLLVEPTAPRNIKHVLLTNDLTEKVMQEAVDLNVELIVSYHPPIFAPLKRITNGTWKERIAAKCLENKIALYSPHTSFDSIKGGVNDWLAESFDLESSEPIEPGASPENGMGRICRLKRAITTAEAIDAIKRRTGLSHVRIARAVDPEKPIDKIAVCAGSGSSVLKNVPADLYVTGEMLHHDILDAVHNNIHVILTNHSDSERGYLKVFSRILSSSLNNSVKVRSTNYAKTRYLLIHERKSEALIEEPQNGKYVPYNTINWITCENPNSTVQKLKNKVTSKKPPL